MPDTSEIRSAATRDLDVVVLHQLLRLRVDVFVVEQECIYPELDGRDLEPGTCHWWIEGDAESDGVPTIACAIRTLADPEATRIGRVVTAPGSRGQGLAAELTRHITSTLAGPFVLDAQSHLQAWYEALGFAVDGDPFVEDGIPHVPMRRN